MKVILNSYTISELRKMISSKNIKKYSKLIKSELIELMIESNKFNDVKLKESKSKAKEAPKKKILKKSSTVDRNITGFIPPPVVEIKEEIAKKERKKKEIKIKSKQEILQEINAVNSELDTVIQELKKERTSLNRRLLDNLIAKRKRLEKQL